VTVLGGEKGIAFINGMKMDDNFVFHFETAENLEVSAPVFMSPVHDEVYTKNELEIMWNEVENAVYYEIEISKSNIFRILDWPNEPEKIYNNFVIPDIILEDKTRYYIRGRAFNEDNEPGAYSDIVQIYHLKNGDFFGSASEEKSFDFEIKSTSFELKKSFPEKESIHQKISSIDRIELSFSLPIHPDDASKIYLMEEKN
jgi:hypothetical protein